MACLLPSHMLRTRFIVPSMNSFPWRGPQIQSESGWLVTPCKSCHYGTVGTFCLALLAQLRVHSEVRLLMTFLSQEAEWHLLALQKLVNRKEISVQFCRVLCTLEAKCVMLSAIGSLPSGSGGHKEHWQYPVSFGGRGADASLSNNL